MAFWYDKKAYALLKKCSDKLDMREWNEYRKVTNHSLVNLRYANLENFYLIDADLQNVDLQNTNFNKAKCTGANVENANISKSFNWSIYIQYILFSSLGALLLIFI